MNYTPFQRETRSSLAAALAAPEGLEFREVKGRTEDYLQGTAGPVTIWIYEDGAEVRTVNDSHRFEEQDYNSLAELRVAFVRQAVAAIEGRDGQTPRGGA